MPTILERANAAGVSAEQVVRVVNGEPVSEDVERRVCAAMDRLGRPAYPKRAVPEIVGDGDEPSLETGSALARLADVAAELEATLPAQMGSVVVEALRVEVRPVAEHVAGLQTLFDGLVQELRRLRSEVAAERRDRVEDLALQLELLRASWTGVDRRLGRIERALARRPEQEEAQPRSALSRIEDLRPAEVVPVKEGNGSNGGQGPAARNGDGQ